MRRWLLPLVSMSISAGVGASTAHGGDPSPAIAADPFEPDYAEPPAHGRDAANVPSIFDEQAIEPTLDDDVE